MVSDTANRLRKTRKKKSSAVPPFRSGHMSAICARLTAKGKVGVQRGSGNRRCPYPSAAGAARSRAPQSATPRLRFKRIPPRPLGANPPAAVRVPRSAGAEKKAAARIGRTRLRQLRAPLSRCREGGCPTLTLLYLFQQLLHIIRQIERALVQIGVVVSGFEAAGCSTSPDSRSRTGCTPRDEKPNSQ